MIGMVDKSSYTGTSKPLECAARDRAEVAINEMTARDFIDLVQRRLTGIHDDHADLAEPIVRLGYKLIREGGRLAAVQEVRHGSR